MLLLLSHAHAVPLEPPRSLNDSPAHSPLPLWAALPLILMLTIVMVMMVKKSGGQNKQRRQAAAKLPAAGQPASNVVPQAAATPPAAAGQLPSNVDPQATATPPAAAGQLPSSVDPEVFQAFFVDASGVHSPPHHVDSAHHSQDRSESSEGVHLSDLGDRLPAAKAPCSDSDGSDVDRSFADGCLKPKPDLRPCQLFECVGQTIAPGGQFMTCKKRLNQHSARGKVCKVHHHYRQCSACPNVIHNECKQLGATQPAVNAPWKCMACVAKEAIQASLQVKEQKDADKESANAATVAATTVVLNKSKDSLVKDFKREGYKVRTSRGELGSRSMTMKCGVLSEPGSPDSHKCTVVFNVKEKGEHCWHIFNRPDNHPCCPGYSTSYHQKVASLPEDCLKEIKKLATSGAFESKPIQDHLYRTNGWKVATELIYMIGYRARAKIFGGTGSNDTQHLLVQQEQRRSCGDTYDLHYSPKGSLKHVVWVSSFAHLLVQYFDYFLCDGTHGISKYGWKFMPLCVVTSGDWIIPIGAVFGLEEDTQSLSLLHAAIRAHCGKHNVPCPAFQPLDPSKAHAGEAPSPARSWAKTFLRNFLYPPEYESCVVMSMIKSWQRLSTAMQDSKCENCGIQGHSSKWCPLAKRTGASEPLTAEETSHVSTYFDFLSSCPIQFPDGDISAAASKAASLERPPTLHTDGGSAFGPLCREIDRLRTACAIHLESKVAACNQTIKGLVTRYV
jgi:hypothetical protein